MSKPAMPCNTRGLPLDPACTRPTVPQLMAQPCHRAQPGRGVGLHKALLGLPALVQIREGDSAGYFTALLNICARKEHEAVSQVEQRLQ